MPTDYSMELLAMARIRNLIKDPNGKLMSAEVADRVRIILEVLGTAEVALDDIVYRNPSTAPDANIARAALRQMSDHDLRCTDAD